MSASTATRLQRRKSLTVLGPDAEQLADDDGREREGVQLDEVALALRDDVVEQLVGDRRDPRLEPGDGGGQERRAQRATVTGVVGIVGRAEHAGLLVEDARPVAVAPQRRAASGRRRRRGTGSARSTADRGRPRRAAGSARAARRRRRTARRRAPPRRASSASSRVRPVRGRRPAVGSRTGPVRSTCELRRLAADARLAAQQLAAWRGSWGAGSGRRDRRASPTARRCGCVRRRPDRRRTRRPGIPARRRGSTAAAGRWPRRARRATRGSTSIQPAIDDHVGHQYGIVPPSIGNRQPVMLRAASDGQQHGHRGHLLGRVRPLDRRLLGEHGDHVVVGADAHGDGRVGSGRRARCRSR